MMTIGRIPKSRYQFAARAAGVGRFATTVDPLKAAYQRTNSVDKTISHWGGNQTIFKTGGIMQTVRMPGAGINPHQHVLYTDAVRVKIKQLRVGERDGELEPGNLYRGSQSHLDFGKMTRIGAD